LGTQLRRIFGLSDTRPDVTAVRIFIIFHRFQILLGLSTGDWDGHAMLHEWGDDKAVQNIFGRPEEKRSFGKKDTVGRIILKLIYGTNCTLPQNIIKQIMSKKMRWMEHVARMGEERKVYRILVGKPKGKRPLGRKRCRWEDGIRIYLKEIGFGVWCEFNWLRIGAGGGLL
jgi:hypothetical protein